MASPAILTAELARLDKTKVILEKHIEANEAEQRRKTNTRDNLIGRIAHAEEMLGTLRSPQSKVVSLEAYKGLKLALNKAVTSLAKANADIKAREKTLYTARSNLDMVVRQHQDAAKELAEYDHVLPFPGPRNG